MSRAILWFRNDLRTVDNAALRAAVEQHAEVLPLYIVDPAQHHEGPFGFARSGHRRRAFLWEGLQDLHLALLALGSGLRVEVGDPADVMRALCRTWSAEAVHVQQLYGHEEQVQVRQVMAVVRTVLHPPNTLLHPADLPFPVQNLPRVFTAFRQAVERDLIVRPPVDAPARLCTPQEWAQQAFLPFEPLPSDPRGVLHFGGGRAAALERLRHYFATSAPSTYKATRNALLGADNSTKFSPWLAQGSLGAREVYAALRSHEQEHGANESTYWILFELLWRDFFQFNAARHGARVYQHRGIQGATPPASRDAERFARWCAGRTGQAFIDANMRELAATGWMSNRGRQNVASHLVHDLGLDWRLGAYWFEHHLLDHDACSNWGNWQYLAGVGNDPRAGRRFDPVRQAGMYDPEGAFVQHWGG